jgi:hypothetical protein
VAGRDSVSTVIGISGGELAAPVARGTAGAARARRLFSLGLLLCTWIPMLFFLAMGGHDNWGTGARATKAVLLFLSAVHVPATALLYGDRAFRGLIRESMVRYVYLPIVLVLGSGAVFAFAAGPAQAYLWLGFWAWQAYHYGRQNVGVYALAATAGGWRPAPVERWILEAATVCGICGTFKVLGVEVAPSFLREPFDLLFRAGYVAFMGVLVAAAVVYLSRWRTFSAGRALFFATLTVFFLPIFLSSNIDGAFFSYAIAHGVQYLLILGVLSVDLGRADGRRGISGAMLALPALALLIAIVGGRPEPRGLEWAKTGGMLSTFLDFALGMSLGCTLAHFVIDAGAWRLRQPSVRAYLTRRFGFLFDPAPAASRG